jgi:hypothetical protein
MISQRLARFRVEAVCVCVPYRACQLLLQHQTAAAAAATRGLRHDGLRVGRSLGRSSCAGGIIVNSLPLSLEEQSELQV